MYFSDVEKTGETDSVEKPKSINGTLFGKVTVPNKSTSSSVTHFGWGGSGVIMLYAQPVQ